MEVRRRFFMVKGVSRQVIVVQSPDPKLFEQAIFILREDAVGRDGVSDRTILRQAQQAAGSFVPEGKKRRWPEPVWAALGAVATGLIWMLTVVL